MEITLIMIIAILVLFYFNINKILKIKQLNTNIQNKNEEIERKNGELVIRNNELVSANQVLNIENNSLKEAKETTTLYLNQLKKEQEETYNKLITCQENIDTIDKNRKKLFEESFLNYQQILEQRYKECEEEFDKDIESIKEAMKQELEELNKIKATRKASQAAILKEKEIKEQREFYMLCPNTKDIEDIKVLETIKIRLHNPRILSMLIWSTYFQKQMSALCTKILKKDKVTGIYKITNQETDECYIGQSVDVAKRWKDHAKCGLGIDTPPGNKLYQAMQVYGIWNFSFELLEECPKEQLNEKEKFYIELYCAKEYGYNSTGGNK